MPVCASFTKILGDALRALERPDAILWSYVGNGVVTFLLGIPLTAALGVTGALGGILVSYVAGGALMFCFYRKCLREENKLCVSYFA